MLEILQIKFTMLISQNNNQQALSYDTRATRTISYESGEKRITLAYQEQMMDENGAIDVDWQISPEQFTMRRNGAIEGIQTYQLNKRTDGFMTYAHGTIPFQVITTKMLYTNDRIELAYSLLIEQHVEGEFVMTIEMYPIEGVNHDE